jgi:hypothetical protein
VLACIKRQWLKLRVELVDSGELKIEVEAMDTGRKNLYLE